MDNNSFRLLRRVRSFYLSLYFFHILHVLEEYRCGFQAVRILGDDVFLAANAVFLALPLVIFFYILDGHRPAFLMGQIYAVVMVVNGLGHNLATLITGRYGEFAGGVSGVGLIAFGLLTASSLQKV